MYNTYQNLFSSIPKNLNSDMLKMKDYVDENNIKNLNVYTVQKGDNLYNIASNYSVDVKTLQNLNGLEADDYIYAGQQILVPKSNVDIYIVEENDTLESVSKKLGIEIFQIINNNEKIYLLPNQLLFFKKREIS